MKTEKLKELYQAYDLNKDHFFKHQHYTIITRAGIEKIQGVEQIEINYEVLECSPNYAAIKASTVKESKMLQTTASALKGASFKDGNTQSWYVLEVAEKRAMSRIVLKYLDLYQLGFFAEDESEEFKKESDKRY